MKYWYNYLVELDKFKPKNNKRLRLVSKRAYLYLIYPDGTEKRICDYYSLKQNLCNYNGRIDGLEKIKKHKTFSYYYLSHVDCSFLWFVVSSKPNILKIIRVQDLQQYVTKSVLMGYSLFEDNLFYKVLRKKDGPLDEYILVSDLELRVNKDSCFTFKNTHIVELYINNLMIKDIRSLETLFLGCKCLRKVVITGWNTKHINNFNYLFCGCTNLEELHINQFEINNKAMTENMYRNCNKLKKNNMVYN